MRASLSSALVVLSLAGPTSSARALALDDAGRACVEALYAAGTAAARAQAERTSACLAPDATGDAAACVVDDTAPEILAAVQATFDAAVAACQDLPAFGVSPTVDEGVSTAAIAHLRGLFRDAVGTSADGAFVFPQTDARGRACQAGVVNAAAGVTTRMLGRFGRCATKTLARGAESDEALAACVASSARGSVRGARKRVIAQARKRCRGVDTPTAFPGHCGRAKASDTGACLGARAVCRACRIANAMGALSADCDRIDDGQTNQSCTFLVRLEGDAIPFHDGPDGRIADAAVSLLEHPERQVVTGPDGHFVFADLEEGTDATVVLSHPDYHAIQTGTIRLGPTGVRRVTFQAVIHTIYDALAGILGVVPDDANRCQMVTTVTRVGKSIYDPGAHGEEGVTVTLDPPLPAEHGPIYFNSSVIPDRTLAQTSDDGGVLFIQVPPGDYTWTAHKAGAVFSRIRMRCRVGFLVNASPPKGLQRH